MRVIAGSRRHLLLKTVDGRDVRPTTDRTKETLFNVLQTRICGARFLDLFSGSGAIAIEAFSRGAANVTAVEQNRTAIACIRENLRTTKSETEITILETDVFDALRMLEAKKQQFEIVFMDPPYRQELERRVLELLSDTSIIAEDTLIIVEAALDTDVSYLEEMGYTLIKRKDYKTNTHLFIKRRA